MIKQPSKEFLRELSSILNEKFSEQIDCVLARLQNDNVSIDNYKAAIKHLWTHTSGPSLCVNVYRAWFRARREGQYC